MKRKIAIAITALSILTGTFSAVSFAAGNQRTININEGIDVLVNGEKLNMTDENGNEVEAFIHNGTTYIPVRAVTEASGNKISWNGDDKKVSINISENKNSEDLTRARQVAESEREYSFELDENIKREHITYDNRYGIEIAADLYMSKDLDMSEKHPAIVIAGPFGAVKEQCAGLYAQEMAKKGFITVAFDPSYCGESGGKTRNMASPEMFTEDYSAAVDYLGLQSYVNREKIGAIGICGLSGMAVTAAGTDTRIKAVATASMYDMSRDMSKGHEDYYTEEQHKKITEHLSQQRWKDAESGKAGLGPHEVSFDENNEPITGVSPVPDELPEGTDNVTSRFFEYYAKRARNSRAVNFVSSWTATTPIPFFNFPLMSNIKDVSPRPVMFIAGENAHSRYYSEDAYKEASEPKELVIVPDADHVDLYDNFEKIPFDKLETFFKDALK